jgi:hypothetical protein
MCKPERGHENILDSPTAARLRKMGNSLPSLVRPHSIGLPTRVGCRLGGHFFLKSAGSKRLDECHEHSNRRT